MAEKEEEVTEKEMKGKERGEKWKGVTYNNTDIVFNRFKMFIFIKAQQ